MYKTGRQIGCHLLGSIRMSSPNVSAFAVSQDYQHRGFTLFEFDAAALLVDTIGLEQKRIKSPVNVEFQGKQIYEGNARRQPAVTAAALRSGLQAP